MDSKPKRILLIDPAEGRREVLARRLRAQGYAVEETGEAATGADLALSAPPAAVVADLWMPSVSGVQLCRLLRSEPATTDVPVILCGEREDPRNRFWADRAGADAYVIKGRTGDLVRALAKAVEKSAESESFFVQLSGGSVDIHDRIARHLDTALFELVIAAELRALASAGSFERLFDLFAQFMSQVARYRWVALATTHPERLAIHYHPTMRAVAEREARHALGLPATTPLVSVEDEDAAADESGPAPVTCAVLFAHSPVARFAVAPTIEGERDATLLSAIVARELGGAVKMAALVEESQRLAATDSLTGLMNRRAFAASMARELARCERHHYPLSLALLDIDHFKQINDSRGHPAGDRVIAKVGELLRTHVRLSDLAARWGGEEFVVAYTSTDFGGARIAAERLRQAIEGIEICSDAGDRIAVTVSMGLASLHSNEGLSSLVDRADKAMYVSKNAGRNRVSVCSEDTDVGTGAAVGPNAGATATSQLRSVAPPVLANAR
jgi:two-component system cell cycle response regulator